MLLFGGLWTGYQVLNDTWKYSRGSWTNLTATAGTAPAARCCDAMGDQPNGGVVLYGGEAPYVGTVYGDTWTFQGGHWSPSSARGPVAAAETNMEYDAADGYLLLVHLRPPGPVLGL